jgi:hypothetical protein
MTLYKKTNDNPSKYNLATRDLKLIQITEEIQNKKKLILNKKKELEKKKSVNTYLEIVSNDYNNYYNYILKQKQNEFKAMNLLNSYVSDLLNTNKLVDNQLRLAKHDQKEILNEIDKIQGELNNIIA